MSENVLKKEFNEKDVQRMRNLIQGKHGNKSTVGVGYSNSTDFYNEGDIWESDGRKWTIKDGIKQNITKLDEAKASINLPLFCPSCSSLMKNQNDKRFYIQYNRCFDCQVTFESQLKISGKWDEYINKVNNEDIDAYIKEYTEYIDEEINKTNDSFFTEQGDSENWVGSVKDSLLKQKGETIIYLESFKK